MEEVLLTNVVEDGPEVADVTVLVERLGTLWAVVKGFDTVTKRKTDKLQTRDVKCAAFRAVTIKHCASMKADLHNLPEKVKKTIIISKRARVAREILLVFQS